MVICIDFDGTCVSHEFPKVGKDIGAAPVLRELIVAGHKLILYTMPSDRLVAGHTDDPTIQDITGTFLQDAVDWFKKNHIELYAIQQNPSQHQWTTSPKCYAEMYIDDCALGIPLIQDSLERKPFVDWARVKQLLIKQNIL